MNFIKERLNYVIIFFAAVAIIACLFPFATVSTTTNKITTSMAMFFLNLDGSGSSPIGIVVALILIAIIILSFFRNRIPKLLVSIFLLSVSALGITAYYIFNIRGIASSVTSASEDVKLGFGCYSIVLCLLVIIGISGYDLFSRYKKGKKEEVKNVPENNDLQTVMPSMENAIVQPTTAIPQQENLQPSNDVSTMPQPENLQPSTIPLQEKIPSTDAPAAIEQSLYFANPEEPAEVTVPPLVPEVDTTNNVENNDVTTDINEFGEQLMNSNVPVTNRFFQVPTTVPVETTETDNNMAIFNQTMDNNSVLGSEISNNQIPTTVPIENSEANIFNNSNLVVDSNNTQSSEQNNIFNQMPINNEMNSTDAPVETNIFNNQPINESKDEIEVLDIFDEPTTNNNSNFDNDEFKY